MRVPSKSPKMLGFFRPPFQTNEGCSTKRPHPVGANSIAQGCQCRRAVTCGAGSPRIDPLMSGLECFAWFFRRTFWKENGYRSKIHHQGTAGFNLWSRLPGFPLGYLFLTQSSVGGGSKVGVQNEPYGKVDSNRRFPGSQTKRGTPT